MEKKIITFFHKNAYFKFKNLIYLRLKPLENKAYLRLQKNYFNSYFFP